MEMQTYVTLEPAKEPMTTEIELNGDSMRKRQTSLDRKNEAVTQ